MFLPICSQASAADRPPLPRLRGGGRDGDHRPRAPAVAAPTPTTSATNPDFGPNVKIFDPSMLTARRPGQNRRHSRRAGLNEFGTERYSLLVYEEQERLGRQPSR